MKAKHRRLFTHNNRKARHFEGLSAKSLASLYSDVDKVRLALSLAAILGSAAASAATQIDISVAEIDDFVEVSVFDTFHDVDPVDLTYSVQYPSDAILTQQCDEPLHLEWRKPLAAGSNTLEIRCMQPQWQGYGRLDLNVFKNVVISTEPLSRANPIESSQLGLQRMNVSQLRLGYFEDPKQLDGYEIQRTVRVGQVITPYIVKAPSLVERGDWVTIISGKGGLTVTSTGEAMKDGVLGEQILVKNLKTDARIKAWIIRKGVVSTKQSDL